MFDIGGGELVVIGIVALVAIGPKELPTVLRTVGRYMGKIKRMSAEFQGQFQEALREAELSDLTKHAEDLKSTVSDFTTFDPMADTTAHTPSSDGGTAEAVASAAAADMAALETTPAEASATDTHVPDLAATSIDLPLPEPLPPVTNEDFAPPAPAPAPAVEPAIAEPAAAEPSAATEPPKRAGDGA
jgi:sec-independent protein translocase protein TatB